MNQLTIEEFNELNNILAKCSLAAVALTLHWSEAENAWWASIDSVAPSEETITKTYSFMTVMKILNEHLDVVLTE
jgi:hypothetical protein